MAERTSSGITIEADASRVMAVIADLPAYPEWATGMRNVEVLDNGSDGRPAKARFRLEAGPIRDSYVLGYEWDEDRAVRWRLAEPGSVVSGMSGSYELASAGVGATLVTYELEVDVAIPMMGVLRRRAEKMIIEGALKELKRRVEV